MIAAQMALMDADSIDPSTGVAVSCMFEKVVEHPDGEALLREFLVRDARGDFLRADPWFNRATTCVGHEPGPDSYLAIADYALTIEAPEDTLRRGIITERQLGWVSFDEHGEPGMAIEPRAVVDTIYARFTQFGWRVEGPVLRQHVLITAEGAAAPREKYADTLRALGYLDAKRSD